MGTGRSGRRLVVLGLLGAASLASVALLAVRVVATASLEGLNLPWNLVLAWAPFLLAVAVYDGRRRNAPRPFLLAGAALWLLFLPNAPYIVTDLKWLREWTGVPDWFDAVLILAFAGTGLALGFASLYLMHTLARRLVGSLQGWTLVLAVLALSSFGVYLGRFQRWNSWDLFTQPVPLLSDVGGRLADPLEHGRMLAGTALATLLLALAYTAFYRVTHPRLGDEVE